MKKESLKAGAFVSYVWVFVHFTVNFIYAPLLIKYLGKSEYGLYQVIASFLAYINVIETSVSSGVLRFYCNALAKGNEQNVENILAICRKIYRWLSLITIGIAGIMIPVFRAFYRSSMTTMELNEGSIMLGLLFANLVVTMANAIYLAAIRGNERFVFERIISMISQILQPVVCLLVLRYFPYATVVTCIQVGLNILVAFVRYTYAKKELHVKVRLYDDDKKLAKSILVFASSMLLSNIADQIFLKTDQIILARMYNTAVVAVYAIGSQIYTNYMYAGITVASVFFPRVSKYYQEEDGLQKISDLFIKVGRIAFFLCLFVLTAFIIFGKEFIYLWVGEGYLPAYAMAIAVMVPFTVDVIQNLGLTILQVMNKYSFRAKMYFVAACLNIVSTIIMAYFWKGFGAALSTGLSMFVTSGIILNVYYAKSIGLEIKKFWKSIFIIFIKMCPLALGCYILNYYFSIKYGWIHFIICILLYIMLFLIYAYFIAMNDDEKELVKNVKGKIIKR